MTWNSVAKGMKVLPGDLPGMGVKREDYKTPHHRGIAYELTNGETITVAQCVRDPRNVAGYQHQKFRIRLKDQNIRDPKQLFAPESKIKRDTDEARSY